MDITKEDTDVLVSKLKGFFDANSRDYSFILSTDKLSNISATVTKMIVSMYFKTNGKYADFKQKLNIMRQPGVSNMKFDRFTELLFKFLENECTVNNSVSVPILKNRKKRGFLELIRNSDESVAIDSTTSTVDAENEIQKLENRLLEISKDLLGCEINSESIQIQPNLREEESVPLEDDLAEKTGRNYINGVQVCLDPEMDLLKIAIQNKSMVNFYKQKLSMSSSHNNLTDVQASTDTVADQIVSQPRLPILDYKDSILQLVNENQLCIITSQTGSGKSTQLPQFFLQSHSDTNIIMTQPRRLAATSLATRISQELGVALGTKVGYKIRFETVVSEETRLIVATEGVLLTELTALVKERRVCHYSHIIIDEAHERSLNLDVILSLIKLGIRMKLLRGTKIIITSAGLNISDFTSFFYNLPVLDIGGSKNFPVAEIFSKRACFDQFREMLTIVKRIHQNEQFNESILIFLPGLEEIEVAANMLNLNLNDIKIIKLHSIQNSAVNSELFAEFKNCRKIIISTNIAETSVTLPSVSFMINSGLYKLKTDFNNISRLTTVPITQMMNMQRVGRLGRVGKGTVYHLFTKTDYDFLIKNNISEIQTTNLKIVMLIKHYVNSNLQLIKEPIKSHQVKAEIDLVKDGSLSVKNELTEMGKFIIKTPLSYSHARLLFLCIKKGCKRLGLILVSMLSQRSPFLKTKEKAEKRKFENMFIDSSDHLSLVNIFIQFTLQPINKREIWCKENDLDIKIMQQALRIQEQLLLLLSNQKESTTVNSRYLKGSFETSQPNQMHFKAESDALLMAVNINLCRNNVAKKVNLHEYQVLSNGLLVKIHPSSTFMGKIGDLPEYICFEEVLVLNDMTYILNISEFNCSVLLSEEQCRGDYRIVKRIGFSGSSEGTDKAIKLLREWQECKKEYFTFDMNSKDSKSMSLTKPSSGKLDSTLQPLPMLHLKKKKKRTLNL